jgi:hypothetical protein
MSTDSLTISTATDSDRGTAPRHRHSSNPVRATKAAVRSYRRTRAARRSERDGLAIVSADPKETQR